MPWSARASSDACDQESDAPQPPHPRSDQSGPRHVTRGSQQLRLAQLETAEEQLELWRWLDVLVEPEEVGRVVGLLQGSQPLIGARRIGCTHAGFPLVAQEVHVDAPARERLHGRPELPCPGHARLRRRSVRTHRIDVAEEGGMPVPERSLILGNSSHGTAQEGEEALGERRGGRFRVVDERLDGLIGELGDVPGRSEPDGDGTQTM
jgi:hypothetical protein